jgi:hypothetical protein
VRFPAAPGWFYLDDEPAGGLQAFAVVASAERLPSFAEWRKRRGPVEWRKYPARGHVWFGDGTSAFPVLPGVGIDRGSVGKLPGREPVEQLGRSLTRLKTGEVVEVWAFPVRPREAE